MKKLRIIYALLFSMALFFAIPLNAAADFGPKPSVSISFRNAGGQTCYSAVLARGSFQPSLGELVTEDAYSTEWFGELTRRSRKRCARLRTTPDAPHRTATLFSTGCGTSAGRMLR